MSISMYRCSRQYTGALD